MALAIGQTVGPYRIDSQLGHGGMATIYRATDTRLKRPVAIKVMHPSFLQDSNFLARFEREAQIAASLGHPHIVPIYDFSEVDGQPYLVMRYIEGRTLKAVIERQPPTLDDIRRLLPPLASALDYAHQHGILHRDIKPSNILIDPQGTPYLTDFGLARMAQLGESTLSSDMLLGTPHYISPEQAQGRRDLDARTDLYSFAVVLYELLAGRVPFSADTPFAVIHGHIYQTPPPPSSINPEIPPAVDAVLEKALAKVPAARYATATELVAAFENAVVTAGLTQLDPERVRRARGTDDSTPAFAPQTEDPVTGDGVNDGETLHMTPTPRPQSQPQQAPPQQAQPQAQRQVPPTAPTAVTPPQIQPPTQSTPSPAAVPSPLAGLPGMLPPQNLRPPGMRPPAPNTSEAARKSKRDDENESVGRRQVDERPYQSFGDAMREAGESIRDTVEDVFNNEDYMYAPEDDDQAIRRRVQKQMEKRREFFGHLAAFVGVNIVLWIIFGFSGGIFDMIGDPDFAQIMSFPWPLFVLFGWGAGLLAHGVDTYYQTGERARAKLAAVRAQYRAAFGARWWTAPKAELKRIRRRAEQPFEKRKEFFSHLATYIPINIMVWLIFAFNLPARFTDGGGNFDFPWPLFVTLGWGIGLVSHAVDAFGASRAQRVMEQEVARERARLGLAERNAEAAMEEEKPKNERLAGSNGEREVFIPFENAQEDRRNEPTPASTRRPAVRLTDDGELTESFVQEIDSNSRRQTRR